MVLVYFLFALENLWDNVQVDKTTTILFNVENITQR